MNPIRLLVPFLLFILTADGLSEETQLLCKQDAIYAGRAVERDRLVNLVAGRLRDKLTTICEAVCNARDTAKSPHFKATFSS